MTLEIPGEFLGNQEADWRDAVEKALKGAPFDRLRRKTEDGLVIEPLYAACQQAQAQAGRGAERPWRIIQRVDHPDTAVANELLLADLEGGASGFELVLRSDPLSSSGGVSVGDLAGLDRLLDGVLMDLVQIRIGPGDDPTAALALIVALAEKRGIDPKALDIIAAADVLGWLGATGRTVSGAAALEARVQDALGYLGLNGYSARLWQADGRIWHGGGATQAQELAYTIATGIAYLRSAESSGADSSTWAARLSFTLTAEADQIGTIAKARAVRRLWANVLSASGLDPAPMHLHMETSRRMMTAADPWVNMLRGTVAAFSAAVGGADSIAVLPFTEALGLPDGFARRIARNTQSILLEESNLHRVEDPAAGSGAFEARTEQLAAKAWEIVQSIEAKGGMLAGLTSGSVQSQIAAAREQRSVDVAKRKRPITGVSEFPNVGENPVETLAIPEPDGASRVGAATDTISLPPAGGGALFEALVTAVGTGQSLAAIAGARPAEGEPLVVGAMPQYRISEDYEALRKAAADQHTAAVFLATLGPIAEFTARAGWSKNFFEAGGLTAKGGDVYASLEDLVAAFKASGAKAACLVGADERYGAEAASAATALKGAGCDVLYMAGRPGEAEDAYRTAGVEGFIFAGCNVLAVLRQAHAALGLSGSDAAGSKGQEAG